MNKLPALQAAPSWGACLLMAVSMALPLPALASANACVRKLHDFGDRFSPEALGKQALIEVYSTPNANDPANPIRWTKTSLDGSWVLTAECRSCSGGKFVTELSLTGKRALPCGLAHGLSRAAVVKLLGPPDERQGAQFVYLYPPTERNQTLTLTFVGDQLRTTHWAFYFG